MEKEEAEFRAADRGLDNASTARLATRGFPGLYSVCQTPRLLLNSTDVASANSSI